MTAHVLFFRVTTALESRLFLIPDAVSLPRCRWKNQGSFPVSTRNEKLIGPLFFGFVTSHLYSYITTKHETGMQSLLIHSLDFCHTAINHRPEANFDRHVPPAGKDLCECACHLTRDIFGQSWKKKRKEREMALNQKRNDCSPAIDRVDVTHRP